MKEGILLIAIGEPFYKELSYNMALSLKSKGAVNITLLTDDGGGYYSHAQRKVFDEFITADEDHYSEDYQINPFKLKTLIYYYSPYQRTIYLDSDGLWVHDSSPEDLFNKLSGIQFHEVARYNKDTRDKSQMIWYRTKKGDGSGLDKLWEAYDLSLIHI